jgi:hypothetical protein
MKNKEEESKEEVVMLGMSVDDFAKFCENIDD